jgi:plastocyanin
MTLACPTRQTSCRSNAFCLPLAALLTLCLGCTKDAAPPKNPSPSPPGSAAVDTPAPPAANGAVAAAGGGTLKGTISFGGDEIPPETLVPILTDPQFCEKHGKEGVFPMEDYLIDPETRGIRFVIVNLKGDAIRKWANTPKQDLVLDNRNCRFEPHVGLMTVGSTIEVKNSDEVYHTTHLYGPAGYQFNPGLRTKGESEKTELTRPGLYVVKCDRHGWMSAFLRVDDHPFHAVTDAKGHYEITGIPPGTHQVEVYHEKFGERPIKPEVLEVTIEADQTATLDLKLSH